MQNQQYKNDDDDDDEYYNDDDDDNNSPVKDSLCGIQLYIRQINVTNSKYGKIRHF